MSDPIRILLADDHAVVRNGLAALLSFEEDLEVVGQASNGREALELFENTRPHVVLMDLRMPELGGADAIRKLEYEPVVVESTPGASKSGATQVDLGALPEELAKLFGEARDASKPVLLQFSGPG